MKKIFTLVLIAAGTIGIANAQSKFDRNDGYNNSTAFDRNHDKNDFDHRDNYFSLKEKEAIILNINREFNHKIAEVKWNRYLNNREKKKMIKALEMERREEIVKVEQRYERSKHNDVVFDRDHGKKW